MKIKKDKFYQKRDIMERFLSILRRKEVGDLKYTLKI